jgi:hypothetical protein
VLEDEDDDNPELAPRHVERMLRERARSGAWLLEAA